MSERTITRELPGYGIKSFTPHKTPMLARKHVVSRLNFAEEHLEKGNEYWKTVIWSNTTKIELFGRNGARHVWRTKRTAYYRKNTIPTVKHRGGSIMGLFYLAWHWCSPHH